MLQSKTKVTKFAWYVARPWSQKVKVHTSVLPLKVPPCKFLASSYTGSPCTLYSTLYSTLYPVQYPVPCTSTLYPVQGHPVPVPIVDWLDRTPTQLLPAQWLQSVDTIYFTPFQSFLPNGKFVPKTPL